MGLGSVWIKTKNKMYKSTPINMAWAITTQLLKKCIEVGESSESGRKQKHFLVEEKNWVIIRGVYGG